MRLYRADLHVHTCLSPCGDLDMSPRAVVETALARGLDIIAVCDHNSADNVAASLRAASRAGGRLVVLPGLEICTVEEVHLLALFDRLDSALAMQKLVYSRMSDNVNRPEIFGEQVAANEFDEVEFFNDRLLIGAVDLDLIAAAAAVHRLGGLAAASHVDRRAFSLLGVLGFIPPGLDLDALEVSPGCDLAGLFSRRPELRDWPIIRSSDAHHPAELGRAWTDFRLDNPSLSEIALALKGREGRFLVGQTPGRD
ncbi:MAG: PHP-associated domain-containing protein [Pseudomonadota bacterium]